MRRLISAGNTKHPLISNRVVFSVSKEASALSGAGIKNAGFRFIFLFDVAFLIRLRYNNKVCKRGISFREKKKKRTARVRLFWSRRRESNPHIQLGKLMFYH
jgi:hypothetical protein